MEHHFEAAVFLFQLLVIYQLKHYFADYPLQIPYMLGKFKKTDWQWPLASHAGVHAALTFIICVFYVSPLLAFAFALFDGLVHFVVDRVKASPDLFGKYTPNQKIYWNVMGADQLAHHLTHYIIIFGVFYYTFS